MSKRLDILFIHPNGSKKVYQDLSKDHSAIEPPIWAAMLANQANLTAMTASERAEKERMQKADERVNKGMKEMGSMLSEVFSEMMKPLKEVSALLFNRFL